MLIKFKNRGRGFSGLGGRAFLKKKHHESALQEEFARWLDSEGVLFTASCAGMRTHPRAGARMKRMGAKKGVPDIMIFEPRWKYHGLMIELKSKDGHASKEQIAWRDALNFKGYHAAIMPKGLGLEEGLEWCKKLVTEYMNCRR
jgi:hypothetical protein